MCAGKSTDSDGSKQRPRSISTKLNESVHTSSPSCDSQAEETDESIEAKLQRFISEVQSDSLIHDDTSYSAHEDLYSVKSSSEELTQAETIQRQKIGLCKVSTRKIDTASADLLLERLVDQVSLLSRICDEEAINKRVCNI